MRDAMRLGVRNQETLELARRHCTKLRIQPWGGSGGLLEPAVGLPIDMRRIECPVAIGDSAGSDLESMALEFLGQHCRDCAERAATGEVPNLATLWEDRAAARAQDDEEAESETQTAQDAWRRRRAFRVGLRVHATQVMAGALDDIDEIDVDPRTLGNVKQIRQATQRLVALADKTAVLFSEEVIEHAFELVAQHGVLDLLQPLRHLAQRKPEMCARLVGEAESVLQTSPNAQAGRVFADFANLLDDSDLTVTELAVRSLIVLAGSKSTYHYSGHRPVVQSNDPTGLRALATHRPELVQATLRAMLPKPAPTGIELPSTYRGRAAIDDLSRQAAAGSIGALASTHPLVTTPLIDDLIASLRVDVEDSYDTGVLGTAQRALATMFASGSDEVLSALVSAGTHASTDDRERLMTVAWQAVNTLDPRDDRRRQAVELQLTDGEAATRVGPLVSFLAARLSGDWGAASVFHAADYLEDVARDSPTRMLPHLPALIGGLLTVIESLSHEPVRSRLLAPDTAPPFDQLDEFSDRTSRRQGAGRLVRALEYTAAAAPIEVIDALTDAILEERDTERGEEVAFSLLRALGDIGAAHGDIPHVLQHVLPTLHTFLVDTSVGLRAEAIKSWTTLAARQDVPSSLVDLLPALLDDKHIVVAAAVVNAASRLTWPPEVTADLIAHAAALMQGVDPSRYFDEFRDALRAAVVLSQNDELKARIELAALKAAEQASLHDHQVSKLLDVRWHTASAEHSAELARFRLRDTARRTFGLRAGDGDAANEALTNLLGSGPGLTGLDPGQIVETAAIRSPSYPTGTLEFAEVAWRSGRPDVAADALQAGLLRTPDEPSYRESRMLLELWDAACAIDHAIAASSEPTSRSRAAETVDNPHEKVVHVLSTAVAMESERVNAYAAALALRAHLRALLKGNPVEPPVATITSPLLAASRPSTVDRRADPVTAAYTHRAEALTAVTAALREQTTQGTPTARYIWHLTQLADAGAHLLLAGAGAANADREQVAAHLKALQQRLIVLATQVDEAFLIGDPLGDALRTATEVLRHASAAPTPTVVLPGASLLMPLTIIQNPRAETDEAPAILTGTKLTDDADSFDGVAVALISIDDNLVTGPTVLNRSVHTLQLEVQTDAWPRWATTLDAEFLTHLHPDELERPTISWPRVGNDDTAGTYHGTGPLQVRFDVPPTQPAPPVRLRLTWRGTDDSGAVMTQRADVAGHREIRIRPYDPSRDLITDWPILDERLLGILDSLAHAGHESKELRAFARLLTAISREGLRMTWSKKYRKGTRVLEREFHNDLHTALMDDPLLERRVERGEQAAHGYLDVRHDGITAELKVERKAPVTPESATRYIAQPTQYAAAEGRRLSILAILDMSPKVLPSGTPDNYVFVLQPQLHGLDDPRSDSTVAVLAINGNYPVPSWYSRRKTPTA